MRYLLVLGLIFTFAAMFKMFRNPGERGPDKILRLSLFKSPAEVGAVTFRRFWNEVNSADVIVLGSSPYLNHYDSVWSEFIAQAKVAKIDIAAINNQTTLRKVSEEAIEWAGENVEFDQAIVSQGKIIFHVIASGEALDKFRKIKKKTLFLFQGPLPLTDGERTVWGERCGGNTRATEKDLSCLGLGVTTERERKRFKSGMYAAVINKYFGDLNILFLDEPEP